MLLANAPRTSSLAPWLGLLLALVVAQVLAILLRGPVRRRRPARRGPTDAAPTASGSPLVLLAAPLADAAVTVVPTAPVEPAEPVAPPSVDWSAVEQDLAGVVGPAVRALVDQSNGAPIDAERVRALADELVHQLATARGLDAATAAALAGSLGDRLLEIVAPIPVT